MKTDNTNLTLSSNYKNGTQLTVDFFLRTDKIDWSHSPQPVNSKRVSNIMTKIILNLDVNLFIIIDKDNNNYSLVDDVLASVKEFKEDKVRITHKTGLINNFDGKLYSELKPRLQNYILNYEFNVIKIFLTQDKSNQKEVQSILELYDLSL